LATASLGSSAVLAADITTPPQALNLVGTSAFFGDSFDIDQMNDTFADQFTFSVTGIAHDFDAIVSSISRTAATGLDITGLAVYNDDTDVVVASGSALHSGAIDVWTVSSGAPLEIGDYYVQVSGTMVSATSGSFGGAVMLAPIPEPAAYGMMLAGLGLVGFMARRATAVAPAARATRSRSRQNRRTRFRFAAAQRRSTARFLMMLRLDRISSICSKRTGLTMWWSKPASRRAGGPFLAPAGHRDGRVIDPYDGRRMPRAGRSPTSAAGRCRGRRIGTEARRRRQRVRAVVGDHHAVASPTAARRCC
jgi:hypothetical protein